MTMAKSNVRSMARGEAGSNVIFKTNRDIEYTIKGIYDEFEEDLPKYFMVTTGSYSGALDYKIRPGQVFRIECTAMQKRVAGQYVAQDGQPQLFSFHSGIDLPNVHVLTRNKTAIPYSSCCIRDFTKDRMFPVTIKFTRKLDKIDHVGQFQLTHTLTEMHLLGNLIKNDKLVEDVVYFPVYFGDLRLVEITGIRDQPTYEWQAYQINHQRESCGVEYDTHYSSIDVAIYKPPTQNKSMPVMPVTGYTEAVRYTPMSDFLDEIVCHDDTLPINTAAYKHEPTDTGYKKPPGSVSKKDDHDLVKKLAQKLQKTSPDSSDTKAQKINDNLSQEVPKDKKVDQRYCKLDISIRTVERERNVYEEIKAPSKYSLVENKTKQDGTRSTSVELSQIGQSVTVTRPMDKPALPKRPTEKGEDIKAEDKTKNTDIIRRVEATQMAKQQTTEFPKAQLTELNKEKSLYVDVQKLPKLETINDVEKLTINELGEFLKVLQLGPAVDNFKERLIDGAILVELDKDTLESEFGLTKLEAIRLLKFAKTGHVPV